jgi:hypothetical protein
VITDNGKLPSKYQSVQGFKNIKQIRMENPGFYSLSKKVKEWQTMQQSFEKTIREALCDIGCFVDDQDIEFYLSFLLSTSS